MLANQQTDYEGGGSSEYIPDDEIRSDGTGEMADLSADKGLILEQDRLLPLANIGRIMKNVLPDVGKLSKEAKECMQECVSEFLLFVSSEASDICASDSRKTLSGDDVIAALAKLGFDNYVDPSSAYLRKYREALNGKVVETPKEVQVHNAADGGNAVIYAAPMPDTGYVEHSQPPQYVAHPQQHYLEPQYVSHHQVAPTTSVTAITHMPEDGHSMQELKELNLQPVQMFSDVRTGQHYLRTSDGNFVPIAFLTNQGAPPQLMTAPISQQLAPSQQQVPPAGITVTAVNGTPQPPQQLPPQQRLPVSARPHGRPPGGRFHANDDVDGTGEQSVGSFLRRQQKLNPKRSGK